MGLGLPAWGWLLEVAFVEVAMSEFIGRSCVMGVALLGVACWGLPVGVAMAKVIGRSCLLRIALLGSPLQRSKGMGCLLRIALA